jgi:hypothetical protein
MAITVNGDLADGLSASDTAPVVTKVLGASTDALTFLQSGEKVRGSFVVAKTIQIALSAPAPTWIWLPGALVTESVGVSATPTANAKRWHALAERLGISALLTAGRPVSLSEGLHLSSALAVYYGAQIVEALRLLETPSAKLTSLATIAQYLSFHDAAANFFGADILEGLGLHLTQTVVMQAYKTETSTVALHETMTPKLVVKVTQAEGLDIQDAQVLQWLFSPVVSDTLKFEIGVVEPGGGFTTWAVNTRTGAVTEYTNYAFNSFASIGHRYYGASDDGLFVLDGDDDDGDSIIAHLKSGLMQLGGSRYSSFKAAYLGIRGSGQVYLKLEAGTGETYTYQVVLQDQQTTKIRIGKGLRARFFAYELITSGQDFDLSDIEFVPLVAQRRV